MALSVHTIVATIISIVVFAALWETKGQAIPATKEEWDVLFFDWVTTIKSKHSIILEYTIQWRETLQDVIQSALPLAVALYQLVYLTARPVVWGIYSLLIKASCGVYEYVILRLICSETTMRRVRYCVQMAIQWQMARSRQEIAMEMAAISFVLASWMLIRFLHRQRYLDRCQAWTRKKLRQMKKHYRALVKNIASVNRKLAIMTPHAIFFIGMIFVEVLVVPFFRFAFALEIASLTMLLSTVRPVVFSILLLYHLWEEEQQQQQPVRTNREAKSRSRQSIFVDETGSNAAFFRDLDHLELLNYFVVRATISALKKLFFLIPLASRFLTSQGLLSRILGRVEFWFWVWINVIPYLTPSIISSPHPLDWVVGHLIKPVAMEVQQGLFLDFPNVNVFWTSTVLVATRFGLEALVFSSIISQDRAELLIHLAAEGRAVVAPFLLVLIYPLRGFGVLCVSHVLPIAASLRAKVSPTDGSPRTIYHWHQTWVIHILLSGLFWLLETPMYFIPFSNILTFAAFAFLSLCPPTLMDSVIYRKLQEELQICHVLPPGKMKDKQSFIGTAVVWILEKIPKASDCSPILGEIQNDTAELDPGEEDQPEGTAFRSTNRSIAEKQRAETVALLEQVSSEKENDYPARNLRRRRVTKA